MRLNAFFLRVTSPLTTRRRRRRLRSVYRPNQRRGDRGKARSDGDCRRLDTVRARAPQALRCARFGRPPVSLVLRISDVLRGIVVNRDAQASWSRCRRPFRGPFSPARSWTCRTRTSPRACARVCSCASTSARSSRTSLRGCGARPKAPARAAAWSRSPSGTSRLSGP